MFSINVNLANNFKLGKQQVGLNYISKGKMKGCDLDAHAILFDNKNEI